MSTKKSTDKKLYVYAIIKGELADKKIKGVTFAGPVYAVPFKGMAIIASPLETGMRKAEDLKNKLAGNIEWAKKNILAHYKLTYELARTHPLIPFKFGMIMASETSLVKRLTKNYSKLEKIFRKIENREEWAIKLSADMGQLEEDIESKIDLGSEPLLSGLDWLRDKKNEAKIKRSIDISVDENLNRFEEMLKKECEAITENMPSPAAVDGEKIVVGNWACLLKKKEVENLRRKMVKMPKAQGFQIIMTGPWPPYNFVSKKL